MTIIPMKTIYKKIQTEIISEEKIEKLRNNMNILKSSLKTLENIKEENQDLRKSLSIQDLRLGWLSKELENIQNQNNNLQIEIKNKVNLFNALKALLSGLTLKGEYFEILENGDFDSCDDLVKIEEAIEIFKEMNSEYTIFAVEQVDNEITATLNTFFKRFKTYFDQNIQTFVAKTSGKLEIHTELYKSISQFETILDFAFHNKTYVFDEIFRKYKGAAKDIFKKEIEAQLLVLKRSIAEKPKLDLKKVLSLFLESISLTLKFECEFLKNVFFSTDAIEIFREIFNLILKYFNLFFNMKEFEFITAISGLHFDSQNEDGLSTPVWQRFLESVENLRVTLSKTFYIKAAEESLNHSRTTNLNVLISNLKFCTEDKEMDSLIAIFLPQISKGDLHNLEDNIHSLNLLFKLKVFLDTKIENEPRITCAIEERLNEFEQSVTNFIFSSDESKIYKKIKNISELMNAKTEFFEIFKQIVFENLEEAHKPKIEYLFSHTVDEKPK